jgi:hypothetical protein
MQGRLERRVDPEVHGFHEHLLVPEVPDLGDIDPGSLAPSRLALPVERNEKLWLLVAPLVPVFPGMKNEHAETGEAGCGRPPRSQGIDDAS